MIPMIEWESSGWLTKPESAPATPLGTSFARPKSSTFACPRLVTKIFAGLMSRWMIPSACATSRASVIWIASFSISWRGSGFPWM